MFTTTDADGKQVKIASTVDDETGEHTIAVAGGGGGGEGSGQVEVTNFPETQPVSGPLTDAELRAAPVPVSGPLTDAELAARALATAANQASSKAVLDNILTELQTLNAALVTANGHLATIATNTTQPIQTTTAP